MHRDVNQRKSVNLKIDVTDIFRKKKEHLHVYQVWPMLAQTVLQCPRTQMGWKIESNWNSYAPQVCLQVSEMQQHLWCYVAVSRVELGCSCRFWSYQASCVRRAYDLRVWDRVWVRILEVWGMLMPFLFSLLMLVGIFTSFFWLYRMSYRVW